MVGDLPQAVLKAILNQLPVRVTFIDANNIIQVRNALTRTPERDPDKLVGKSVLDCHPPKAIPAMLQLVEDLRLGRKATHSMVVKTGDNYWQEHFIAVRDEKGNYLGIALVRYDVTEREQLRARLEGSSKDEVC